MTVVYLDSVFFLNGLMDYLLLLVTARLAGLPLRRKRYLAAALLGGFYAAVVFLPFGGVFSGLAMKFSIGGLMMLIAYGGEEQLLRLSLLFLLVSCGMAGCVVLLSAAAQSEVPVSNGVFYTDLSLETLGITALAAYTILYFIFRSAACHGIQGRRLKVRLSFGGAPITLAALWDTGNGLKDPVTGEPVLVVERSVLKGVVPEGLIERGAYQNPVELLSAMQKAAPQLHARLLPYHAVGVSEGMLLGVRSAWAEIQGTLYPHLLLAISPTGVGTGYRALWGGKVKGGGWHEENQTDVELASDAAGSVSKR